jgi:Cyclic nucleotide-binding domain
MLALTVVFGLFKTAEYGSWISITIFANGRGGVSEAAAVLVAQLVPATATAIWVGSLQLWIGPRRLLIGGLLAQAAGLIATASAIEFSAGGPVVYVAAVVAASAMVTTRPAISALLPAFAETPRTLTRAHVFLGWFDSAAGIVGPLTTAACLLTGNAAFSLAVFAGMSGLGAVIAASASPRIETVGTDEPESPPLRYLAVVQKILRSPGSRGPLLLLAAQALAVGCLDLLIVVVASHVGAGTSGAGWFGSALGLGAVIGSTGCIALIGRRLLWRWVVGATVVGGIAIAGLCIAFVPATAAAVFAGIALAGAVVSATGRALLQRLGEPSLIGQLFAFAEASDSAMLLLGALVVPALIALGGLDVTYVALAVLTLIVAAVVATSLAVSESRTVDTSSRVLEFRRVEPFRQLRLVALEALARTSHLQHYKAGELLMTQGEPGDDFHVVATGRVSVIRDGVQISVLDAPVGVGELALLYGIPRTATVSAVDDVETISVDRDTFLLALDHQPPTTAWQALVEARLGR